MKCTKCGKEITNDSTFCEFCIERIKNQLIINDYVGLSQHVLQLF